MPITATGLKMNLGKYLLMTEKEDIYITRNGKMVEKLSNVRDDVKAAEIPQFLNIFQKMMKLTGITWSIRLKHIKLPAAEAVKCP